MWLPVLAAAAGLGTCVDLKENGWCGARRGHCGLSDNVSWYVQVRCNSTCGCKPASEPTESLLHRFLSGPALEKAVLQMRIPSCDSRRPRWQQLAEDALRDGGTALVIGANTGPGNVISNDPLWAALKRNERAHKVFVEPIPAFFRALQANLRDMPRAVAVNAAISPGETSAELTMYCLVDPESGASPTLGKAALQRKVKVWWSQICSLSRERLFAKADMERDLGSRVAVLEGFVRNVSVPALTVDALLVEHVPSGAPVKYVQIDVEGWDDHVVTRLPLGRRGFRPEVIVFEWMLLGVARYTAAIERLHNAGYRTCWEEQNVAAVRMVNA